MDASLPRVFLSVYLTADNALKKILDLNYSVVYCTELKLPTSVLSLSLCISIYKLSGSEIRMRFSQQYWVVMSVSLTNHHRIFTVASSVLSSFGRQLFWKAFDH